MAHAVGISSALRRPIVHLQRKILEYEAHVRLRGQRLDSGLGRFTGWTLQITKLDDRDRCVFGSALRTINSLLQQPFCRIKRLGAERDNFADQSLLAVGSDEESSDLLPLLIGKNTGDLPH